MPDLDDPIEGTTLSKREQLLRDVGGLDLRRAVAELRRWRTENPDTGFTLQEFQKALAPPWRGFWSEKVLSVVVQQGVGAAETPGVEFDEILDSTDLKFASRVYSGERGIRRIERGIQFESFLEDRSYPN